MTDEQPQTEEAPETPDATVVEISPFDEHTYSSDPETIERIRDALRRMAA